MKISREDSHPGTQKYAVIDADGRAYYILDVIRNGIIDCTVMAHAQTYDDVTDSEVFKAAMNAKAAYIAQN